MGSRAIQLQILCSSLLLVVVGDALAGRPQLAAKDAANLLPDSVAVQLSDPKETVNPSCGQDCLLQRETENISLRSAYMVEKLRKLDDLKNASEDQKLKVELGSYCFGSERGMDCYDRYRSHQLKGLVTNRTSLLELEQTQRALEKKDAKDPTLSAEERSRVVDVIADSVPVETGVKAPTPTQVTTLNYTKVPRLTEIEEFYDRADNKELLEVTREEFLKSTNEIRIRDSEIRPEDFAKFRTIERVNGDAGSKNSEVLARASGVPQANPSDLPYEVDAKKFERAKKEFKQAAEREKIAIESKIGKTEAQQLKDAPFRKLGPGETGKTNFKNWVSDHSLSRDAFAKARLVMNQASAKAMEAANIQVVVDSKPSPVPTTSSQGRRVANAAPQASVPAMKTTVSLPAAVQAKIKNASSPGQVDPDAGLDPTYLALAQDKAESVVTPTGAPKGQNQTRVMLYASTLNAEIRDLNNPAPQPSSSPTQKASKGGSKPATPPATKPNNQPGSNPSPNPSDWLTIEEQKD